MPVTDVIICDAGAQSNGQVMPVGKKVNCCCTNSQPVCSNGFRFTHGSGERQPAPVIQFMEKGMFGKKNLRSGVMFDNGRKDGFGRFVLFYQAADGTRLIILQYHNFPDLMVFKYGAFKAGIPKIKTERCLHKSTLKLKIKAFLCRDNFTL